MLKYQRALVKLSGEALSDGENLFSWEIVASLIEEIKEVLALGAQIALVVGGGNILRGALLEKLGFNRVRADQAGMMATLINSLILEEAFLRSGITTKVLSAIEVKEIAESFTKEKALGCLQRGWVLILACGTGRPFFSTDTAGVLRALELEADVLLKATKVDGVYDKDPVKHKEAVKYTRLTYDEALARGLKVMDLTAFSLAKEHGLPIIVFKFPQKYALKRALSGETIGTLVSN